jgi:hypothetical protein
MSSALSRGSSQTDPDDQRKKAEDTRAALTGLKAPDSETDRDRVELLEQLSESDIIGDIDDEALQHLGSRDIPTANFDEAGEAEFRAYMDVALFKKRARHPHEKQDITGALREVVHNDPEAGLEPIDRGDLLSDESFAQTMKARVTKGRAGQLVRAILSSIKVSRVERERDDSGGGRLLGRLRD